MTGLRVVPFAPGCARHGRSAVRGLHRAGHAAGVHHRAGLPIAHARRPSLAVRRNPAVRPAAPVTLRRRSVRGRRTSETLRWCAIRVRPGLRRAAGPSHLRGRPRRLAKARATGRGEATAAQLVDGNRSAERIHAAGWTEPGRYRRAVLQRGRGAPPKPGAGCAGKAAGVGAIGCGGAPKPAGAPPGGAPKGAGAGACAAGAARRAEVRHHRRSNADHRSLEGRGTWRATGGRARSRAPRVPMVRAAAGGGPGGAAPGGAAGLAAAG